MGWFEDQIDDDVLQLEQNLERVLTIGHSTSRVVRGRRKRLEIVSPSSS